jgi:hypothetical protein
MASGAPITVIDGFRVIDTPLPSDLFYIVLNPVMTGKLTSTGPIVEFRLITDTDDVFASWQLFAWRESPNVSFLKRVFVWDGQTIEDTRPGSFSGAIDATVTTSLFPHHIAVRKECSSLFNSTTVPVTQTTTTPVFLDSDVIPAYTGSLIIHGASTTWPTTMPTLGPTRVTNDPDSSLFHRFARGIPLPNDPASLAVGSLRLGVKFFQNDPDDTLTVSAIALKLQQESIACDEFELAAQNATCQFPRICPVTAPHYTTPIWEVESASGDVSFSSNLAGYSTYENCMAAVQYGEIADQAAPRQVGDAQRFNMFMGSDHIAFTYNFNDSSQEIVDSAYTFRNVGGDPVGGNTTNFRNANFPYQVCTEILATSDPCEWLVRAHFGFWAWCVGSAGTTLSVSTNARTTASYGGNDYFLIRSPQMAISGSQERLPPRWQMSVWSYEKTVPAWTGEPPTLSFTSADLLPGFAGSLAHVITQLSNTNSLTTINRTTVSVNGSNIAFTLRPFATGRIPYPNA